MSNTIDAAIDEAFPTNTGRHDLYAEALRLVGARDSKAELVELVNWLLAKNDKLHSALTALNETHCAPGCTHEGEGKDYSEAYRIANAKVGVALATK